MRWLAIMVVLGTACAVEPQAAATTPHRVRADVTFTDVTLRQYRGSSLKVVATTPQLELMRTSSDFHAADASVVLQRTGARVEAREVQGNATAGVATGQGQVRYVGVDGTTGVTPRATFDRALSTEGGAYSDAGVSLDNPRFELTATGFFGDFAAQRVDFDQPVTRTR